MQLALDLLPYDILIIICDGLSRSDLMSLSLVNKELNRFLLANPRVFWYKNKITMRRDYKPCDDRFNDASLKHRCTYCYLEIIKLFSDHKVLINH